MARQGVRGGGPTVAISAASAIHPKLLGTRLGRFEVNSAATDLQLSLIAAKLTQPDPRRASPSPIADGRTSD
ncbi:MAG: hypothetical protein ACR2NZ_25535 [Rubripirellula sp.]